MRSPHGYHRRFFEGQFGPRLLPLAAALGLSLASCGGDGGPEPTAATLETGAAAALPCKPGTECFEVDANGARNPDGTSIAQCSGVFPDYVVEADLFPAGFEGPWFEAAQAFPQDPPAGGDAPWSGIDFSAGVEAANAYLYALRDYAYEGNVEVDFRVQENAVRAWYTVPYMNYGPGRREFVHGVTAERTLRAPELGIKPGVTVRNYAIGFYNAPGGYTIGQVWASPTTPDLAASRFEDGAMVFKILFSDATPDDFVDPDAYILEGAPEWQIATGGDALTTVRLLQMDVAVRDDRAQPSGWVFGTFAYDRDAQDPSPWRRLRPVGLQWGNAPGYTPADQQNGDPLPENIISDEIPGYAAGHLGWAGRVNGPVDNPQSACMSCHGTGQYPVDAGMLPSRSCTTDAQRLHWFRNLPAGAAFGAVDSDSCEPTEVDPPPVTLDFSLQVQVSVQSILQYRDVNPCLEPTEPDTREMLPMRSTAAPRVGRDGFFEGD